MILSSRANQPIAPASCRSSRPVAFVTTLFFQEFPYNGGSFTILFVSITKNLPILAYNPCCIRAAEIPGHPCRLLYFPPFT